jgi:TonB family protein
MRESAAERLVLADPSVPQSAPPKLRLVIRVKIPTAPTRAPVRPRLSTGALLLILGTVAVLLSVVGISVFRADRTSVPAAAAGAPNSTSQSPAPVPVASETAPTVIDQPLPKLAAGTAETRSAEAEPRSTETKSVESEVRAQPDVSSPISEVIPNVSRSARETIRGTIRVSIRVTIDKAGTVLVATVVEPGPSRYFRRLATEAAKKWTFTPADAEAQRIMLVRFSFTRAGTTAQAKSLQ